MVWPGKENGSCTSLGSELVWPVKKSRFLTRQTSEGGVGCVTGYKRRFVYKARERGGCA